MALQCTQRWLDTSIDAYQTIGVETVLSSSKYRHLVEWARLRGFRVQMIYVVLDTAARQIERVALRVSEGGHDVPADKVIERRRRSFDEFAWFPKRVDGCLAFDNSTGSPELIAEKVADGLFCWDVLPADLEAALHTGDVSLLRDIGDLE